ncbi:MAG: hypothetical protein P8020_04675 [Acidobacteriota bacterium]
MKKTVSFIMVLGLVLFLSAPLYAATWKNVPLTDANCASRVKNNPDAHKRSCIINCADSGYGILAADGSFLKFDDSGNKTALSLLKASDKADHIRVTVEGTLKGDTIQVRSMSLD